MLDDFDEAAAPVDDVAVEDARLAALDRYDVLDTVAEESFDRITRLACRLFDVPIAAVALVDAHRLWFKSRQGFSRQETRRVANAAFGDYVVREKTSLVVPDAAVDLRFRQAPLVVEPPHVRFFAGVPLTSRDGHALGMVAVMDVAPRTFDAVQLATLTDLARLVMTGLELRMAATTDPLTGALARAAFRREAERAVALARRHHHDLACIGFDLDHFKQVNDQRGHAVGDTVLACTGRVVAEVLRKSDLFGRTGGEEFAVLLPHTSPADAIAVADKLRAAVAAQHFFDRGERFAVTASFGVSFVGRATEDGEALLEHADEALYAAKDSGRNCCRTWQPSAAAVADGGRRVLKAGKIVFNGGHSSIDCTVRRLSPAGAAIDVYSAAGIPPAFKHSIDAEGFSRLCQTMRKNEKHLEVAFA